MRKAVFLLLLVLMVYVAGIYGSTPLMVLAAAETVTLAVMFGLSRYLTGKLTVRAPALSGYAVKGETFFFEPEAENRGRFPVAKFRLQVEKGYENSEPEGTELIYNKLMGYLKTKGLETIEALDKEFDTDLHEAVAQFPVEDADKKGKVYDVVQTGYTLNGKVIRFAKVVVAI